MKRSVEYTLRLLTYPRSDMLIPYIHGEGGLVAKLSLEQTHIYPTQRYAHSPWGAGTGAGWHDIPRIIAHSFPMGRGNGGRLARYTENRSPISRAS